MKEYCNYNQQTTFYGRLVKVLRDVRCMPTYPGCDPYNATLGFSIPPR